MKITTLLLSSLFSLSSMAAEIVCFNPRIQDSQITATFRSNPQNNDVFVLLGLPQGEFGSRTAWGFCAAEEDSRELSLRCDQVVLSRGKVYFARLDGNVATVAKDGKILARIPCFKKN